MNQMVTVRTQHLSSIVASMPTLLAEGAFQLHGSPGKKELLAAE